MIQPGISLAVETPLAPDPLETAGKALSIRSMQQQQLLHGEQLKSATLANQETELKRKDDQIASKTFLQAGGDRKKHIQLMAESGARPQTIQAYDKHYNELEKQDAEIDEKKAGVQIKRNELLLPLHDAALSAAQNGTLAQEWPQIYQQAAAVDPETAKHFTADQPPTVEQIQASKNLHMLQDFNLKQAKEVRDQATRKEQAAAAQREADLHPEKLREAKAKAGSAESDAAIKQFEVDAAKATPEQQAAKVAASIDQAKYPEIYKRTLANVVNGVTHQEKMSALHAGSAEVAEREKETDPNIRKSRVATAVATEQALTPLKIKQAVDTEIAKAKASGDAFGGIVDPVDRHRSEAEYDKYSQDFLDKAGESRRLKDLIKAAQNGNRAAPGVIPIEELRGFVNRVNTQELKAVGPGAGSLVNQIEGKIGKLTKGQPIPADILKDIGELADLGEKAAERTYNFKLQILKQKGAKVSAIKPEDVFGSGKVAMVAPDGTTKEVDAGEVAHYEQLGAKRK